MKTFLRLGRFGCLGPFGLAGASTLVLALSAHGQPITYAEMVELPRNHTYIVQQSGVVGLEGLRQSFPYRKDPGYRSGVGDNFYLESISQLWVLDTKTSPLRWTPLVKAYADARMVSGSLVAGSGYGSADQLLFMAGMGGALQAYSLGNLSSMGGISIRGNVQSVKGMASYNGGSLVVDSLARLYLVNLANGAAQVITPQGQLYLSTAIAFGPNGHLYVLDGGDNRVAIYYVANYIASDPNSIHHTLVGSFPLAAPTR